MDSILLESSFLSKGVDLELFTLSLLAGGLRKMTVFTSHQKLKTPLAPSQVVPKVYFRDNIPLKMAIIMISSLAHEVTVDDKEAQAPVSMFPNTKSEHCSWEVGCFYLGDRLFQLQNSAVSK